MSHESIVSRMPDAEVFQLLVEQIKDYAIFVLDVKGHIVTWNQGARRIKGYSPEDVIGRHFSIFYPPEDISADKPARELLMAIEHGRHEDEGRRVRKDGTTFWANVVITPLRDRDSHLTGFAKITRDLSLRKMEEDSLRQKTQELTAFAHTLSHDLRAPLRTIASFSGILKDESATLSEKEKADYLGRICDSVAKMQHLIEDILSFSKLGTAPVSMAIFRLDEVIHEVLTLLASEIQKTKAIIEIKGPLPSVKGNRTVLAQIFSNLIGNSMKFVAPGKHPHIEIFAISDKDLVRVHVQDHGIGIPEEHHHKIFEAFERIDPGKQYSGTGLGLTIVKKSVDRLGGQVEVQSNPGQGSDFIVSFQASPH